MHFKLFWMPCLHIKNFTSAPIPELAAVENFTKRWKGILGSQGSLVGFKKSIQIKKDSYQTWLESINQKCGEKSAYRIKSRVSQRSQAIKISFFLLLLLRILLGKSFYMLSDSKFLKIILIGQISSHRWINSLTVQIISGNYLPCQVIRTRLKQLKVSWTIW